MAEIIKRQDSRRTFVDVLNKLAEHDDKIICIIPDVGFLYLDNPANKFKVVNLGVTEQSSTIIAAALALSGFKVFYYTMINFALFRNAEMVRNAIVCHNAPVTILGVKGSTSYKFLGFSHNLLHAKEDFNFCDNIGLEWMYPTGNEAVEDAVTHAYMSDKPHYIRL